MNFPDTFFQNNRKTLRDNIGTNTPIVIVANGLLQKGSDATYPFHQDANFWYLTGINEPDIILVIDSNQEFLIIPGRSEVREFFDGATDSSSIEKTSGITTVVGQKAGWEMLSKIIKKSKKVATLAANPGYIKQLGMYTNPARQNLIKHLKTIERSVEFIDIRLTLASMRSLKQPIELQAIQKAIDITTETLSEVIKRTNFEKYRYENEIEADISGGFRRRGADGDAFTPIVASGKRACTIHYDANNAKLGKNELVIMDVGAQFNNYAADIARTVSVNKNPSERSQAVYNAVLEACEYAKSQLKPGVMMKEYELSVRQFIGKKLKELGLIKIINPKKLMRYYPHATSHFLGLEPHDAGDYSKPLQDGMVLAVEPGIYIAEESIGVRIENNVLITTSGVKVLSGSLPCTLS